MAETYASIIKKNPISNLKCIVGNKPEKINILSGKYNVKTYLDGNLKKALKEFPETNVVLVATPEWVRIDPIETAIRADKHVLYEKPMATSYYEAKKIYSLINKANKNLIIMPIFNLRFNHQNNDLRKKILENTIGDIRLIISRRNGNNEIIKRVLSKISPIYWLTPHEIDLIRWITNTEVKYVETKIETFKNKHDGFLTCNLKMKNGINVFHLVSWCSPPLSSMAPNTYFEVIGNKGIAYSTEFMSNGSFFTENNIAFSTDTFYKPIVNENITGPFKLIIEHFIECVLSNSKPLISNNDALETIRICSAMEISNKQKKKVFLKDIT